MPSADTSPVADAATPAAAVDWLTPIELTLLGAIWGASFMFQRVAAPEFGAIALAEIRLAFGAVVLLPFLWHARRRFPAGRWPMLALIGAINSAVPFALFAWASQYAPAGIVAITNAMAVLFTALVGFLFFHEAIGWRRGAALMAGFAGVVVLASGKAAGASLGWAVVAGCAAAFLYGVGVHMLKRHLAGLPPAAVAAATLGTATLLLGPIALAQWPSTPVSGAAWFSATMLGVVCTGLAYALYYRLVQRVGPGRAVSVTYLVPLFAVAWAWWLLDEPLTVKMAIAGVLILGSVAFSQRSRG
ncbi:MAG TPA: DMT family transporter [Xanthomonadaceae bacterium]|nr:DMT family transporter [Xanthomonadaceae bacterium]